MSFNPDVYITENSQLKSILSYKIWGTDSTLNFERGCTNLVFNLLGDFQSYIYTFIERKKRNIKIYI